MGQRKYTQSILIRTLPREHEVFRQCAEQAGQTVSDWIRLHLRKAASKQMPGCFSTPPERGSIRKKK